MHIGIDGRMVNWSGIGRYTQNILKHIVVLDKVNDYSVFCHAEDRREMPGGENVSLVEVDVPVFSIKGRGRWTKILKSANLDLFYTPYIIVPFEVPCRAVGTIHDLIPWRMPSVQKSLIARLFYRRIIKRAAPNWDCILVDSNFTRDDVVNFLQVPKERIRVVPAAAEESFRPVVDKKSVARVCNKYGIKGKFVLNVGIARPHKNLPFLIEVFGVLIKERNMGCKLVFAGGEDKWRPAHRRLIKDLGLQDEVIFTGHVSDDDLAVLYSQATLCAFPSLFEGFGLPALEAMACGCPVVCSDNSSLAEIVGEAGILLNSRDRIAWIDAIESVLKDENLWESMKTKGLERARQFSWEKTAGSILEVFEEVGGD